MPIDDYDPLAAAGRRDLDALSAGYDAMFDQMQTPEHRAAARALFGMTPTGLGNAAVAGTRRNG
jgi:hypothetical protein